MSASIASPSTDTEIIEQRVRALLDEMTLAEKIGQMSQVNVGDSYIHDYLAEGLRAGRVGSVINEVNVDVVNELQRIAVEESRLGIPLLVGRDVIHGFKTVMPIPLGQAATWNPDIVREGARVAALEAATVGVNWTFAPMIDISRDARWGRIAESLGEDPYLASALGAAMVEGFQGDDLAAVGTIAACAKHFAGYGAAESGRDYASTNIPENELRNVYLRPFKAAVDAGVLTLMASFSDIDGVPATGNEFLMRQVLRDEWQFDGFVVSDWDSIRQLRIHGLTGNDKESAFEAATAGVDMEMHGDAYGNHLEELIEAGRISVDRIDTAAANILRAKFRLGLFEDPYARPEELPEIADTNAIETARTAALQSVVMLKNDHDTLPLSVEKLDSIALIGPLTDAPYEQLGTWIFDGDPELSITPMHAIHSLVGHDIDVRYVRAMENSRSQSTEAFGEAVDIARDSDAVILFLGEESILSGEAHSRADISLPGAQAELVRRIRATGKPVVAVILAGRPLTLTNIVDEVDAILFAWHPGTMGGPAIADLLFGVESPSGKLPATFPRMVGQIPIYYNQKNTGKPPSPETIVHIDDIDAHAPQLSLGMTAFHLDAGYTPLFAFGHGLSYATFNYERITTSAADIELGESVTIGVELTNTGAFTADEVVQLYIRDLVGNVTRPVKELKGFRRVRLDPGESTTVNFELHTDDLGFYGRNMQLMTEPGEFHAWIGGSSETELRTEFRIIAGD
ncbi:MAG: glycoside hydrolase family 3 C-terminal domain-containing protein [Gammaproteobacteria bacterium]|nr:glycoside hydrolase family 3 C-terminal domain-containing protein [Gammaproteobacteria bacterium]MDH3432287.1 glycoside hydrolase family 3 C-terminal domain-containing protein [Gammaproteobacteria bacterium]